MVNQILKKSVSLQVLDMFVMYLKNKQRNGKIYYVFNIYLYNATGKIKFNQAILETKTFFSRMKSGVLPPMSNGAFIMLKIEFAHRAQQGIGSFIDWSNGRSLILEKPIIAQERRTRQPAFEISDIHWCYRTGFSRKHYTGNRVIKIHTNPPVTVFETEVDFDYHDENKLYVCINSFFTSINSINLKNRIQFLIEV